MKVESKDSIEAKKNLCLSIVIPVFNNFNFTKSAVTDLIRLPDDHEIVIVDNGSADETQPYFEQNIDSKIKYIKLDNNTGFAKACNIGYKEAHADNVMFLNNDIRVQSNHEIWTKAIIEECDNFIVGPTLGMIDKTSNYIAEFDYTKSSRRTDKSNINKFIGKLIGWEEDKKEDVGVWSLSLIQCLDEAIIPYMSGWCVAASKNIWNKLIIDNYIGPFSEEFGIAYFEDTDMGIRALQLGIDCKMIPVPVHHFGKMTSKKVGLSKLYPIAQKIFRNKWNKILNA